MDKLYWLDQIKLEDRAKVGDKAFYLSRIFQMGYPVIPGFVISAGFLREFLTTLQSSESLIADFPDSSLHLNVGNWRQLQQVAQRLRQEITSAGIPSQWVEEIFHSAQTWQKDYLVFRPTIIAQTITQETGNLSGLIDSIFCPCHPQAIAEALKLVWSQLFRARSLVYWQNMGINLQKINLAVLVQPVEQAIASGLFNAHSLGWEIEATWGLGLAITNGEVLPDTYCVHPGTGTLTQKELGNKMLAYGLDASVPTLDSHGLSVYLLEEAKQKQFSLSEEHFQEVVTLGNQLVTEMGATLTLKWTLVEATIPKLYVTQVSHPPILVPSLDLIKGIGASSGRVTATAYVSPSSQLQPEQIPRGVILITPAITPDCLPLLQEVAGIVTDEGGITSHGAILSRELGIPAIVNTKKATSIVKSGDQILIDGEKGEIRLLGTNNLEREKSFAKIVDIQSENPPSPKPIDAYLPMIATKLLINLSQSNLIPQVQNLPVDGIGLIRSELMLLSVLAGKHPHIWLENGQEAELLEIWSEQIIKFASAFAPKPIFYRSLDWGLEPGREPIMGQRGAFVYIRNPALFKLELQALAIAQNSGYANIHLLLPFVRTVEEFIFCRGLVEEAGLTQIPQFQLWIMAEVPSVLFLLPEYIKAGVKGISIGTNDLTQLILGVDREQGELGKFFNERHPAVMMAIAQIIQMAVAGGIPCGICGQAPALYPEIIDQLVAWGISYISVEANAVEQTHQAIARAEQRLILGVARQQAKII